MNRYSSLPQPDAVTAGTEIHEAVDRTLRAKPFNGLTQAACAVGIEAWQDEIDYLKDIIAKPLPGTPGQSVHASAVKLHDHFKAKHDALVRARDWLQSMLATRDGGAS